MPSVPIFKYHPAVVGMVHLKPLPGSPGWGGSMDEIIESSLRDARALKDGGVDGIMVENFWDIPFTKGPVEAVTVAAMTKCVDEIRFKVDIPLGVNVLRNDGLASLSIAQVTGARFIRVNVLASAMVTDQGIIEGCSYELLRLRSRLHADVLVMADVMVKHAYPLGAMNIVSVARDTALRGGADVLIVSGSETGAPIEVDDVEKVRKALPDFPLASGSGVTADNVRGLIPHLDILIIGTWFKQNGDVKKPVDPKRVAAMVDLCRETM
jgi:membrane complex biogenesis BtpA family protein